MLCNLNHTYYYPFDVAAQRHGEEVKELTLAYRNKCSPKIIGEQSEPRKRGFLVHSLALLLAVI